MTTGFGTSHPQGIANKSSGEFIEQHIKASIRFHLTLAQFRNFS